MRFVLLCIRFTFEYCIGNTAQLKSKFLGLDKMTSKTKILFFYIIADSRMNKWRDEQV